jgi:sporulation protein YlmC with PRC-barrel domain
MDRLTACCGLALSLAALVPGARAQEAPAAPRLPMSAEALLDRELYGADGRNIGAVRDVAVDGPGRVAVLVVGVGGFLGLGEREVEIPFDRIRIDENGRLTTTLTRDQAVPPP